MKRPRDPDLDQFRQYVEDRPRGLGCWRAGATDRRALLAWLNVEAARQTAKLAAEIGGPAAVAMNNSVHHNQVGIAAAWVTDLMVGEGNGRSMQEQDRVALFNAAAQYWSIKNALVEVGAGVRGYETAGRFVRLPFTGDVEVDALDRLLDLVGSMDALRPPPFVPSDRFREWVRTQNAQTTWAACPEWVRRGFRKLARAPLAEVDTYFEPDDMLAGIRIGDFDALSVELLAWAMQMSAASTRGSGALDVLAPLLSTAEVARILASGSGVERSVAERVVQMLTIDVARCPDPALTSFAPVDDEVVPMFGLILPSSPQRNLLANAQNDPSLVGKAGTALGHAGERAALETLKRMGSGIMRRSRIRARRTNGEPAGD